MTLPYAQDDAVASAGAAFQEGMVVSHAEMVAEAFEFFFFTWLSTMKDAADKFASFCSSLTRMSPTRGPIEDPALLQARTEALWDGIRRVYFGETESERHERVMDDLRDEIAELEENLRLPPSLEGCVAYGIVLQLVRRGQQGSRLVLIDWVENGMATASYDPQHAALGALVRGVELMSDKKLPKMDAA
jgi:hypothetical protein